MLTSSVRHPRRESASSAHVGRGGAANIFKPSAEELAAAKRDSKLWESVMADDEPQGSQSKGWADKGKGWLLGKSSKA